MGRKGISIERTFTAVSDRAQLEAKVCMSDKGSRIIVIMCDMRCCGHIFVRVHMGWLESCMRVRPADANSLQLLELGRQ